ncbi:DUF2867 domain-containing protein [Hymenobacter persicinus]|uniref:DUF2867 domain-containing protein n=1 Tax=Hymenobacter persicinus TaxID=2025506 RepID=A0A4Q5LAX9_9BACT|nr:DUF2867 domain-containing protein [Hymenobacter persicinus]RYU75834.1 DUF2867 domain-containing protein [Hymenobacter persicinus]
MPTSPLTTVAVPVASQLYHDFPGFHYADAYALVLPPAMPSRAPAVAQRLFGQAPGWVRRLLRLRDWLVRPFGLVTFPPAPPRPDARIAPGEQLGPFRIFRVSSPEVLLGLDDRHLDFRVSVWVTEPTVAPPRVVVSTAVRFHNPFGRLYFTLIRPVHGLVVKALLRQALRA